MQGNGTQGGGVANRKVNDKEPKQPKKPNQKPLTLQPLTFAQAIQKAVNTKVVIAEKKKKA